MSSRRIRFALPVALVLSLALVSFAFASTHGHGKGHDNGNTFTASLNGHEETPVVHTKGTGTLTLTITSQNPLTMSYTLTYSGLNSTAGAAHVHLGQPDVAGGVVFFLCGGGNKPACPPGGGTVSGQIVAADIMAPLNNGAANQGLVAGDIAGMIDEIRAGFAYANVHTSTSPQGEIRGQLSSHGHDHGDNDED